MDVFAEEKYAGNQLAAFTDAKDLSDTEMQRIAKEMNYSETRGVNRLPFIIVPLKTLDALKRAKVARDKYFELIKDTQAKAMLIFSPETCDQENDLNVRVFADYYGVPEDPVTGSANGCLAGYLVKYCYFGRDQINIRVEQGYEIGRPSLLLLGAEDKEGEIDVSVGGRVVMIAKGEFI